MEAIHELCVEQLKKQGGGGMLCHGWHKGLRNAQITQVHSALSGTGQHTASTHTHTNIHIPAHLLQQRCQGGGPGTGGWVSES